MFKSLAKLFTAANTYIYMQQKNLHWNQKYFLKENLNLKFVETPT